jgi:hypothetical protein
LKQCFINFSQNITFQLTRSSSLLFTLSCCAYWYPTNTKCSLGTNISTILRKGIFLRDDNQFSSKLSGLFVTNLIAKKIISRKDSKCKDASKKQKKFTLYYVFKVSRNDKRRNFPSAYSNKPNRQLRLVTPLFLTATIT